MVISQCSFQKLDRFVCALLSLRFVLRFVESFSILTMNLILFVAHRSLVNDNDNVKKLNNKDVAIEESNGFFISKIINNMPKHGLCYW
jgi:hypothetical protein